mmetsp:Transcript_35143/g.52245  ORF Transcript_35143/g.52245 Transcript_35143/m.52245 type:complete len:205 (-) Transcript_35143:892-1506(-)
MLMQNTKLFLSRHAWSFGNEEPKFSQYIGSNTDRRLVASTWRGGNQKGSSSIGLQISLWMVRYNLNHTMPNGITDMISTNRNEFENRINVPAQIGSILFGQNSNLENHFFTNGSIGQNQMCHQFIDNSFGIVGIAHDKQQIQGTTPNTNVGILETDQHRCLMLFDTFCRSVQLRQFGHRHETQITNVGFPHTDKLSEQLHGAIS